MLSVIENVGMKWVNVLMDPKVEERAALLEKFDEKKRPALRCLPLYVAATLLIVSTAFGSNSREIALSFDDAPAASTPFFKSGERTRVLIKKLKELGVPSVMIFANTWGLSGADARIAQIKLYKDAGHIIANHTSTHPRLDEVGYAKFSADAKEADELLGALFVGQKFFRFPFLNEGTEKSLRDSMRKWLDEHNYKNGMVSIDNDDYIVSHKINQAKILGKEINFKKVESLFLDHLIKAADFYDQLAVETLGRSPKHVILLHERDATVMFIKSLVLRLREQGWKIVGADEAYKDPIYSTAPENTYANNGIIAQLAFEKIGKRKAFEDFERLKRELNKVLGLPLQ